MGKSPLLKLAFAISALALCFGLSVGHAQAAPRVLYFTFDDGPSQRYTPKILDILRQEHVQATFFVLGFRSEEFPSLVRRMRTDGHEIGNHGYYHQSIVGKPDAWVKNDVRRADDVIERVSGGNAVLYRPPGGLIDQHELAMIHKVGHPVVLWTVDSQDWRTPSSQAITDNVMRDVQPEAIVLFHDGVSNSRYTVEALATIIHKCRAQGYTFKVLPVPR